MDQRLQWRFDEMMEQAEVSPEPLKDLLPRVRLFLEPFLQSLSGSSKKQHALEYTTGLMSGLKHKTGEGIPTCTTKTDREFRSSSDKQLGIINLCCAISRFRSA